MILLNYQVFLDAVVLAMACVARSERKEIVSFIIYTPEYSKFHKKIKSQHYFSSRFKISRSRISNLIFSRNREYSRFRDDHFESSKQDF